MKKTTLFVMGLVFFTWLSLISAKACDFCHYVPPPINHLPNVGFYLTSVHTPVYYGGYDRNPDYASNYYSVNRSNYSYYWNTNYNNDYYWYYNNQNVCSNTVPVFSNFNPVRVAREGSLYTSYALATSSGDKVTYRFVTAPDGMTIDPNTGLISWTPNYSQGRAAAYTVTVAAANCFREVQTTYYLVVTDVQFEVPVEKPVYVPTVIYREEEPEVECDVCTCENLTSSCSESSLNDPVVTNNGNGGNSKVGDEAVFNLISSLGVFISAILALFLSPIFLVLIILILLYRGFKK